MDERESRRRAAARRRAGCVAALAAWLMVACGGGGGGGGGNAGGDGDLSGRHYFPAATGDRWSYVDGSGQALLVKAVSATSVGGKPAVVVRTDGQDTVAIVEDADGVRQLPLAAADALDAAVGPVLVLRYPLRIGDSFVNVDKPLGRVIDFDGDGQLDDTQVRGTVTVVETAPVTTALARFDDALHVVSTRTYTIRSSALGRTVTLTERSDDWLAPGVGLVRSVQTLATDAVFDTQVAEITGYGVGGRRSETTAPTATAPALATGDPIGPPATLEIGFDEDMDADTLTAALTVTDALGRPVAGSVTVAPRTLRFVATAPWTSGGYSATLAATATDAVGNPAAARTWPFTVDADAPSLVNTLPLEGAVDVPLASAIVLGFSEPVAPASVGNRTISVIYDGALLTAVDYAVTGRTVTLTPATALARGRPYSVFVAGVTDLAGNTMPAAQLRFTTDPGRFGAPVRLPTPAADMTAGTGGDVDGDGRPDLVAGTLQFIDGRGWESQLAIYAQPAGGGLPTSPVLHPLQAGAQAGAQAVAIAIADVDLDGRNDVIVAEGDRSVEIFRQGTDGRLLPAQPLALGIVARLKVADMNGDGRPDLVAYGDNVVSVWLNLPGGWTRSDAVTVSTYPVAYDLSVGDLDGDGRPDVVIVITSPSGGIVPGVLRQGSDGRLGAATWLPYQFDGAFFATVTDVDGDGRGDLLAGFASGLVLARQQADSTLAPFEVIDPSFFTGAPIVADLNRDGRPDVLTIDGLGTLVVRLGQAGGTLAAAAAYPGSFLGSAPPSSTVVVADIDGDGLPDVLAGGWLFRQRPVGTMAQSLRPGLERLRAALKAAAGSR